MPTAIPEKDSRKRVALLAILVAAPPILFFALLQRFQVNIPVWDDYDALLSFANDIALSKGFKARFLLLLASQHTEYKIFFADAVAWAQLGLTGHLNFAYICVLGNSAVFLVALVLWWQFLPGERNLARRLAYFVPVSWLLFQFEYSESLNWAVAGLQNLWVVAAAIGAIACLLRPSRKSFACALVLYALATGALGNGFLLLPVGLLIMATRRQLARALIWLFVSAICIGAYAYNYNVMMSQSQPHSSVFAVLLHLNLVYVLAFVGNAGAIAGGLRASLVLSMSLGAVLLILFGWLVRHGYCNRNPFVACCVLFLLLTALGVAGIRSDFGIEQSMSSRYTVYGILLVIFAWTAVSEEYLLPQSQSRRSINALRTMTVLSVMFSLLADVRGYRSLSKRERESVQGMVAFEHSMPGASDGPILREDNEPADATAFRKYSREVLIESIQLGVYDPPKL
jgi:hypothetical protein